MSYTLECLIDTEEFDCINKVAGCHATLTRKDISCHIECCSFGPTHIRLCQHLGYACSYQTHLSDIKSAYTHFTQNHSFKMMFNIDVVDIRLEGFRQLNRAIKSRWTPLILDLESKYGVQLLILSLFNSHEQAVAIECIQLNTHSKNIQADFVVEAVDPLKTLDLKWSTTPVNIRMAAIASKPFIQFKFDHMNRYLRNDTLTITCAITKKDPLNLMNVEAVSTVNVQGGQTKNIYADPVLAQSTSYERRKARPRAPPLPPRNPTQRKHSLTDLEDLSDNFPCSSKSLKLQMDEKQSSEDIPETNFYIFKKVTCNKCGGMPIFEYYKCLQCPIYNLCTTCMDAKKYRHHIFALVRNRQQNSFLKSSCRISKQWRPFFVEPLSMLGDTGRMRTAELLCSSCADYKNGLAKYICLNCELACRLCSFCFPNVSKLHFEDHLFAVVDTETKLRLVVKNYNIH